jgi:peptidoglycan/LPS O-acetylase OafA/YrhL
MKKARFEELDALRGCAALLVVFFHFTKERQGYDQFFKFGTTGVDLFFIISGFVIFMSLQRVSRGIDFIINRISRLYPTYWAAVTFAFLIIIFRDVFITHVNLKHEHLVLYLGNLTMFQFYLRIADLDGPYWTMIIEMIFYISILILFQLKSLKRLTIIGISLCSITVIATRFFGDTRYMERILYWIPLLQFLPLFFAGTVFYKVYTERKNNISSYLIIAFCFLCQILLFPYVGRSKLVINQLEYSLMLSIYFILFILFVNNKLKFIANDLTLFFGKISFALYLIHQYISLGFIIPIFHERLGINFWVVTILIDLPIVVGIASFITYKIEAPYSKKLKQKLQATWYREKFGLPNTIASTKVIEHE